MTVIAASTPEHASAVLSRLAAVDDPEALSRRCRQVRRSRVQQVGQVGLAAPSGVLFLRVRQEAVSPNLD